MAAERKRNFNEILDVMLYDDSSTDDSSSSDEDHVGTLLVEMAFAPKVTLGRHMNLADLTDSECEQMFRFLKDDLVRLGSALQLPPKYVCRNGTSASGMEALMILLRRLSYPNRWGDLVPLFGRAEPELSVIFTEILDDIYSRFNHLLRSLDLVWLDLEAFSAAIHARGAPLDQCWGFIDGTVRPIARPILNQRVMYSGHKRTHCLKFQSVETPNGLIANMFGPIEGRRHDAFMLGVSGLSHQLRSFNRPNGEPYVIYGDPAYGLTRNILAPFRGASLTRDQQEFNKAMSRVRISVEWGFGKICQYFAFLDFKKNNKVLLQPVGKYFLVASLLINCHTCLYGSLTSSYFDVSPPSLETFI